MTDCTIIRAGSVSPSAGKQALDYVTGVSAQSCGSRQLCMQLLVLPPGSEARAHLHEGHESAIYVLEGSAAMRHGPRLEQVSVVAAGDFVLIPAGAPHQPFNPTDRPVRALVARTDPDEQESVVLL